MTFIEACQIMDVPVVYLYGNWRAKLASFSEANAFRDLLVKENVLCDHPVWFASLKSWVVSLFVGR